MRETCIIHSPRYLDHDTGAFHPESKDRLTRVLNKLREYRVIKEGICEFQEPRRADQNEIMLVHDKEYVMNVKRVVESGLGSLDPDTPVSKGSYEAAMMAAGGALKACELILDREFKNAFALVRPPGHHAGFKGRALGAPTAGFCIFNNIAIAAESLIKKHNFSRVLILDLDCHHGNGTQEIFNKEREVMFVSIHQDGRTLYPGTGAINDIGEGEGEGYKVNIPLPPSSCDDVYLKVIDEIIRIVAEGFKPEFILISAGFDSHWEDPVTNMGVSTEGFRRMYSSALTLAENLCQSRLMATLEGGYGAKFDDSVVNVIRALTKQSFKSDEEFRKSSPEIVKKAKAVIKDLRQILSSYWDF